MSYFSKRYPGCVLKGAGPDGTDATLLSCIVDEMVGEGKVVRSLAQVQAMGGTPDRWWSNDENDAILRVKDHGWFVVKGGGHLKSTLLALVECEGKTISSADGLKEGDVNVISYQDGGAVKIKLEGKGWFLVVGGDPAAYEALID